MIRTSKDFSSDCNSEWSLWIRGSSAWNNRVNLVKIWTLDSTNFNCAFMFTVLNNLKIVLYFDVVWRFGCFMGICFRKYPTVQLPYKENIRQLTILKIHAWWTYCVAIQPFLVFADTPLCEMANSQKSGRLLEPSQRCPLQIQLGPFGRHYEQCVSYKSQHQANPWAAMSSSFIKRYTFLLTLGPSLPSIIRFIIGKSLFLMAKHRWSFRSSPVACPKKNSLQMMNFNLICFF